MEKIKKVLDVLDLERDFPTTLEDINVLVPAEVVTHTNSENYLGFLESLGRIVERSFRPNPKGPQGDKPFEF
jgi:hypothetical protein